MINLQAIAEKLIQDLEAISVVHKVRAEGVKIYHDAIMNEIQNAQKKEADEQAKNSKPVEPAPADKPAEEK